MQTEIPKKLHFFFSLSLLLLLLQAGISEIQTKVLKEKLK
jgi:hypothetical protein